MQRGERDLRGADQEQLVARDLVDHLPLAGEEAGAEQRALADEHRRHDRLEALARGQLDREAHQRQLDHHQVAEQVGEPRARGLGRLLHLDPAVRDARGRGGRGPRSRTRPLADLAQRDRVVLARPSGASGSGRFGSVARELVAPRLDLGELAPRAPSSRRRPRASRRSARSASSPARLAAAISSEAAVLPRAPLLDLGQQLAAARVELEQLVERLGGAAARERRPGRARVLADAPRSSIGWPDAWPPSGAALPDWSRRPRRRAWRPVDLGARVLGDELGDGVGLVAGDDVLGHDRAREAAVADREEDVLEALARWSRFGPCTRSARFAEPWVPGGVERVAARAALGEQHRAA